MNEHTQSESLSTADLAYGANQRADDRGDGLIDGPAETVRAVTAPEQTAPLFPGEQSQQFRSRWDQVQGSFVDEPRRAVEQADGLVAETMKNLAETFAKEREKLEQQWNKGEQASTEDLRMTLQRYRSFFDRLLTI